MNRKTMIAICLTVLLGMIGAKLVYKEYKEYIEDSDIYNGYLLQQGVYTNEESLNDAINNLSSYIVNKEDNKYYVYLGVTTNIDNANKIKQIYNNKKIDTYIKPVIINNIEFISNLEQYDVLLKGVDNDKDILSINDVILSDYEEMVLVN